MTETTPPAAQGRGYAIALVGTAVWSTTAIFIRYLTEQQMPPFVLAFWRDLLAALALLIVLAVVRPRLLRLPRRHLPFFLLYGLVLMVFNATWTVSVDLNGAAVSTVLIYSSPAITAVLAWALWREPLSPGKIAALLLSLIGCVLVSGAYSSELWSLNAASIGVGLFSGLMFAVYSLFGKETAHRGVNSWTALTTTFGFAAVFFLIPLLLPLPGLSGLGSGRELLWLGGDLPGWGVLILLAWGPTIGGYGLYTASLNYLPASVASLIVSLEPALTTALAFLLLGERLTPVQLIGSVVIIGAVVLLRVESMSAARRARRGDTLRHVEPPVGSEQIGFDQ